MDIKQVQELVKIINKTNISEIRIEEEGLKITIKQKDDAPVHVVNTQQAPQTYYAQHPAPTPTATPATPKAVEPAKVADNLVTIKSPMIGTFYRSPSPDKPAFVNIGDEIGIGNSVCVIEAMKLFNEIESEVKGTIVKVLVDDASPVEYDQPLFLVEPN